jgi:hypothetical protein
MIKSDGGFTSDRAGLYSALLEPRKRVGQGRLIYQVAEMMEPR